MSEVASKASELIPIVIVCGPTASGKTRLAVDLAKAFNGEVINADSMQVYKGMEIASASPSEEEKQGVIHHLFSIIEPEESFSVADWLKLARDKISEISEGSGSGKLPIIAGGTGLYITSLIDNIIFDETGVDLEFRAEMKRLAVEKGNAFLLEKLNEVDPEAASFLHENNVKRIIRALETSKLSGANRAERLKQSRQAASPYREIVLGTDFAERETLYERINKRIDIMLENGLLEEAKRFYRKFYSKIDSYPENKNFLTASQALGHKELYPYLKGQASLEECVELLKQKTRNYAKRQLTWFRRDKRVNWLITDNGDDYPELVLKKSLEIVKRFVEFK